LAPFTSPAPVPHVAQSSPRKPVAPPGGPAEDETNLPSQALPMNRPPPQGRDSGTAPEVPYQKLDVLDEKGVFETIKRFKPDQIYHLAALLSATAEKNPKLGWQLNMDGLFYVLDAALEAGTRKVYWPSSIAAFGPNTPRHATPQYCVMDPNTVYGISKLAGERYAEYYFKRYGLDVRSLRYPGLIGWKSAPGGVEWPVMRCTGMESA
jgi:nucleoside-diphosphate-sugar epimerase